MASASDSTSTPRRRPRSVTARWRSSSSCSARTDPACGAPRPPRWRRACQGRPRNGRRTSKGCWRACVSMCCPTWRPPTTRASWRSCRGLGGPVRPRGHAARRASGHRRPVKGQKTNRPPRSVDLLGPLRADLAVWRGTSASPPDDDFVFARADGGIWREDDWRNWRKRIFAPAARAIGVASPRAYDLRHSFASLLIHEGRLSIVEPAEQLGHTPTMWLSTYAHVMAERRGAPRSTSRPRGKR